MLGVRWCFKLVTSFQQSLLNVQEFKVTGRQWILGTVERLKWIVDLLPCKGIERLLVLCRLRNLVKRDPAIISPQSRINCINHRLNPEPVEACRGVARRAKRRMPRSANQMLDEAGLCILKE